MDPEDLRREIDDGGLSVARIQYIREDIEEIVGLRVPKDPRNIEKWWTNNKSVVGRKLNEKLEESSHDTDEVEESEEDSEDTSDQDLTEDN